MGRVLNDCERDLFDKINRELNELAGVQINYYGYNPFDPDNCVNIDPLYGEPEDRNFAGPYRVWALVKYPEYQPLAEEVGFGRDWDAVVTISRSHLDEQGAPYPTEGDVIEMWRTPFHDAWSMGVGLFFDVIKASPDGYINDSPSFTQFKLGVKRRSQFGAERRITPP